ncbi:hypothetical protein EW146_g5589 [Bondarzewia mesenterica]|uniref:Uncharacterized protein n=1 Tax=Bondarzewia mesenterica TaxID=1095465 RepID=A0A4S4LT44_9AGAM|nr:hypothetical protein EW146_g5589 [Bondarzewia mesenterica]
MMYTMSRHHQRSPAPRTRAGPSRAAEVVVLPAIPRYMYDEPEPRERRDRTTGRYVASRLSTELRFDEDEREDENKRQVKVLKENLRPEKQKAKQKKKGSVSDGRTGDQWEEDIVPVQTLDNVREGEIAQLMIQ